MDFGHSGDMDIGCHTTQDHFEAFLDRNGSESGTSPVGDLSPFGQDTGYTPLVGWCKERHTHLVGRDLNLPQKGYYRCFELLQEHTCPQVGSNRTVGYCPL